MSWAARAVSRLSMVIGSTVAALVLLEGLCRVFTPPIEADKTFVVHPPFDYATCYPTDGVDHFPVNLRNAAQANAFLRRFPDPVKFETLRQRTPWCVTYDQSPNGPRRLINPSGHAKRVALLGDSFAFGEGVTDDRTFGHELALRLDAVVRVYAWSGADLEQVEVQFQSAMDDAGESPINAIVYLFVLNDPLKTDALRRQGSIINEELMNLYWERVFYSRGGLERAIMAIGRRSALFYRLAHEIIFRRATEHTIQWYRATFDPAMNPRLVETFDRIERMDRAARSRGIAFYLVIYPLMIGLADYPLESAHQTIRRLAAERHLATFDLLPAFQAHAGDDLVVHRIDLHPNAAAHRIAAEATARAIDP